MDDDAIRAAARLCFFAHYHPRGIVADYVLAYLHALRDAGFAVVVLSTADLPEAERTKLADACARLVMRENVGLDFGGWIDAFRQFMPIRAELLLLANDSVYGPIGDLAGFIDRLIAVPADFYGAVESWEGGAHLQSWFLLLRPAAYGSAAFRAIMTRPIPPDMPKLEIIGRYERRLMDDLTATGLRHHAAFTPAMTGPIGRDLRYNPAQVLWRALVTRFGVPFIKVELLRENPHHVAGVDGWRRLVRRRSPELVPMIAADLATRDAAPKGGRRDRYRFSAAHPRLVFRPELTGLIVRDAVARNGAERRFLRWAFDHAVTLGTAIRRRLGVRTG